MILYLTSVNNAQTFLMLNHPPVQIQIICFCVRGNENEEVITVCILSIIRLPSIFRRNFISILRRSIYVKNIVHFFFKFLNLSSIFDWSLSLFGSKYVTILLSIISIAACVLSSPRRSRGGGGVAYAKPPASASGPG